MRARRIMSGIRRIGMVAALILSLPLLFGLWTWVTLGHAPPRYVYVLLVIGLGAHVAGNVDRMDHGRLRRRRRIAVECDARCRACHAAL